MPTKITHEYWPSLDGWRAIAVLTVVLHHDTLHAIGPITTNWFQIHGFAGVDLFFGISGFLICTRLLEEESIIGAISLSGFYIRRAFRILPPAVLYLAFIAIFGIFGLLPITHKEWLAALLFGRNYDFLSSTPGHVDWFSAHFWSLSVEEHFYLLLPSVLLVVPKRYRIATLACMTTIVITWRCYRQLTHPWDQLFKHTDTRLDALLIPAILAVLLQGKDWPIIIRNVSRFWPLAAMLWIVLVTYNPFPYVTPTVESMLVPIMILGTALHPSDLFSRILELPAVRWLGKISYSLYLWQQIFFTDHFAPGHRPLGLLNALPFRWFGLFVVAAGSYYLLEKPAIRFGHRLTESDSSNSGSENRQVADSPAIASKP